MHSTMALKKFTEKAVVVLLALLVWQAAAVYIDETILLVTPVQVLKRLLELGREADFWQTIWYTLKRISMGFLAGLGVGIILAYLANRFKVIKSLLWPYMITIKSVPVASFIVIALIWLSSARLSVFIAFLMVLPIIYTNLLSGAESTDQKMTEMADVFKFNKRKRLLYITLPQIKPYLISASTISIGLAWKSGVAAEVIAMPNGSIGEALYQAKVYYDTADLFAWTVAIVICSIVFEKLFILGLNQCFARFEKL